MYDIDTTHFEVLYININSNIIIIEYEASYS